MPTALLPTSRGRVVERRPDNDFQHLDAISHKYTGKPFPFHSPEGRVALVIEVDKARYTKLPFEHTPAGVARLSATGKLRKATKPGAPGKERDVRGTRAANR